MTDEHTNRVSRQFSARTEAYATSVPHSQDDSLRLISEMAQPSQSDVVLDLGTGPGFVAHALAPDVRTVVGLDLSPDMARAAAERAGGEGLENFRIVIGDNHDLPFAAGVFDIVVTRWVMHHCLAPDRVVAEIRRVTSNGGTLIICDSVAPEDPDLARMMNRIELLRDRSHARNLSHSRWIDLLDASGFEVDRAEHTRVGLELDDWLQRAATPEASAAELRRTFESPPAEFAKAFGVQPQDGHIRFSWPVSVIRGKKRAGNEAGG